VLIKRQELINNAVTLSIYPAKVSFIFPGSDRWQNGFFLPRFFQPEASLAKPESAKQKRPKGLTRAYTAAVLLLGPCFWWSGAVPLPAVWTFHHWLFQNRVQDKQLSTASFQTNLTGLSDLWSLEEVKNTTLVLNGDIKSSKRLEQEVGSTRKAALLGVFQTTNECNKNNLCCLGTPKNLQSTFTWSLLALPHQPHLNSDGHLHFTG
jgi:hypothetical protein